jgi:hypothetical protein
MGAASTNNQSICSLSFIDTRTPDSLVGAASESGVPHWRSDELPIVVLVFIVVLTAAVLAALTLTLILVLALTLTLSTLTIRAALGLARLAALSLRTASRTLVILLPISVVLGHRFSSTVVKEQFKYL